MESPCNLYTVALSTKDSAYCIVSYQSSNQSGPVLSLSLSKATTDFARNRRVLLRSYEKYIYVSSIGLGIIHV